MMNPVSDLQELVNGLRDKKDQYAYQCLKELESESERSDAVSLYFDSFASMLNDSNSYIRTRGIRLIAANAKWDKDCKIDEIIDSYLNHIMDDKPITARQTIKALPAIAQYKPGSMRYAAHCKKQILRFTKAVCSRWLFGTFRKR